MADRRAGAPLPADLAAAPKRSVNLEPQELAHQIVDILSDKKGEDIVLMDTSPVSFIADYFVIATAGSDRQLKAMLDEIERALKAQEVRPLGIEGEPDSGWVLMDYGSVIVHLFDAGTRDFYDLESLWSAAKILTRIQ